MEETQAGCADAMEEAMAEMDEAFECLDDAEGLSSREMEQDVPWRRKGWKEPEAHYRDFISELDKDGLFIICMCGEWLPCKSGFRYGMYKMKNHWDSKHSPTAVLNAPMKRKRNPTIANIGCISKSLLGMGFKKEK